jgi:protein-L-isoaspartate O-methyltransferase
MVYVFVQHLRMTEGDVVLLVAGGTGYEAALLANMVQTVVCLESDETLAHV